MERNARCVIDLGITQIARFDIELVEAGLSPSVSIHLLIALLHRSGEGHAPN